MPIIEFNVKNDNEKIIVERVSIKSQVFTVDTVCRNCCFYTGTKCHGHGDYWGNCTIYDSINKLSGPYDAICYDYTKCKVYAYLNSFNSSN